MGATTFVDYGKGKDAKEAFRNAVEKALYEHGHGGYSGTIAEKQTFVLFDRPDGPAAETIYRWATNDLSHPEEGSELGEFARKVYAAVDDKWGPAGAVELKDKEMSEFMKMQKRRGEKYFMFFGWASS